MNNLIKLSYYQYKKKTAKIPDSIFNSFSFIKSFKSLIKYDKNNELNILNGFKVLAMLGILFGHRTMYYAGYPIMYSKDLENLYINGPDIFLTSMNLVDPFFFISGYLIYLTISPTFLKNGSIWLKFMMPFLYRIARILPSYCAIIAIMAHVVPHIGNGPLWPQKVWVEAETCNKYWWINLLFISDFIDTKYQCLIISWYISCDIKFFIIGIIILYLYLKNYKLGIALLTIAIGISMIIPFVVTLLTESDGILKILLPFLENPRGDKTFNEMYRPSYMRGTPFLIGIAISFIAEKLKREKFKFSQMSVYGGTFVVVIIGITAQLYGATFYNRQLAYNPIQHSFYAVISHLSWTLIGSWIMLIVFTTGYGPISKLLENKLMTFLGRLSYSVFLVNLIVMQVSQSFQRSPSNITLRTVLDAFIYDGFKTYVMGLVLYLVVEAPFADLIRKMFGRSQEKQSTKTNEIPITVTTNNSKGESNM